MCQQCAFELWTWEVRRYSPIRCDGVHSRTSATLPAPREELDGCDPKNFVGSGRPDCGTRAGLKASPILAMSALFQPRYPRSGQAPKRKASPVYNIGRIILRDYDSKEYRLSSFPHVSIPLSCEHSETRRISGICSSAEHSQGRMKVSAEG